MSKKNTVTKRSATVHSHIPEYTDEKLQFDLIIQSKKPLSVNASQMVDSYLAIKQSLTNLINLYHINKKPVPEKLQLAFPRESQPPSKYKHETSVKPKSLDFLEEFPEDIKLTFKDEKF